jgi:predicted permease
VSIFSRLANVFRSDRLTRDIDEELATHLEEAAAHGRDPLEARHALGPSLRVREESRDIKLIPWLDSLRADLVFAWRQLNKCRITSLAAILSLGLAIGACVSAFRIIDALFLRPLPIANPQRLYALSLRGTLMDGKPVINDSCSYPEFRRMRAVVGDRADLLAISYPNRAGVTYGSGQELERAYRQYVSGRMFAVFGLRPALGRLLTEGDDLHPRAHALAVLSFQYWTRRFGRDPKVLGRTLRLGDDPYTIIGVAPEGFTGVEPGSINDIFVPAMMSPFTEQPHTNWFHTMVVLKPGVAAEPVRQQLQAAVRGFFEEQVKDFPELPQQARDAIVNQQALLEPAPAGVSGMQRNYGQALTALGVLVALVLLIACANVANLITAQAASRAREMALRISIGAGRARLVQLVLVEAALLALFAAAAGVAFAWWAAPFVVTRINPPDNPARLILPADWRVLSFALALTVAIAFLLALAPALWASRTEPVIALKGGKDPHSRRHLMHALIAAQVSFCFLVLFVAGLFVTTLQRLSHQNLGFSTERLLVLGVGARQNLTSAVWEQVSERLRTVPGVEAVASSGWPLLSGGGWDGFISLNGGPPSKTDVSFLGVSPRWMETMRIPFVAGRDLRAGDEFPKAAIVNEMFAKEFFNGGNPIGESFSLGQGVNPEIVGVVSDARYSKLRDPMGPVAYFPFQQQNQNERTFLVRTAGANSLALAPTLRKGIRVIQPELRVTSVGTQQELIDNQTVRERLLAMLGLFFATVALLLAAVGLYGVLDYSVFQRRREIGIRLAIGARASHIVRGVSFGIVAWVLAGSVAGIALGIASARYIESLLYQVKATDASALAIPALALLSTAILAALPPILRAIHIDPVQTLRSE